MSVLLQLRTHLARIPRSPRAFATINDCSSATPPYDRLLSNLEKIREHVKRPLSLAEKILYSHLQLSPERVAMQDASAQMAL